MVHRAKHTRLLEELLGLRKGSGLTPQKLQQTLLLRSVVGQILHTQADSITNNQIYDFIVTKTSSLPRTNPTLALRYALGIEVSGDKLADRRLRLATILKKHSDTVERYENQAFELLADELLEVASSGTSTKVALHDYPQQFEEKTKSIREMTILGLTSHLSIGNMADDLMKALEIPYRPYLNASVHLTFLPSDRGNDWYRFQLVRNFQGMRSTFRVAVVLHESDGELLLNAGLVDDFHKLNSSDRPEREIKTIIATSKFTIRHQRTKKLLRLRELDAATTKRLLRSTNHPPLEMCWILEVTIPTEWQQPDVTYEHQSVINLRTSEHYAYWYSPGLTYLKKLTVDFSQFPEADKWSFFVQPFLGNMSGQFDATKHLFTVTSGHWILPGHGIVLIWQ